MTEIYEFLNLIGYAEKWGQSQQQVNSCRSAAYHDIFRFVTKMPRDYKRDSRAEPCRKVWEVHEKAINEVQNGVLLRVAVAKYTNDYTVLCRRGEKCLQKLRFKL